MEIIRTAFQAALQVGLPLFILTFALIWWALLRGRVEGDTHKALQESMASLVKRQKDKEQPEKVDPALGKWFSFGGGFYGLVALYTWILIEWDDVSEFIMDLGDLVFRLDIGVLIRLFIESIMNFVAAIAWPVYWLQKADNPWIWFGVAYAGYWLGIQAARHTFAKRRSGEKPD